MQYTDEQLQAIRYGGNYQRAEAGPGSGKTATLVARLAYLIEERETTPEQILALTFTRAAAEQMRQRLARHIGQPLASRVWIHTFHALAYRLLREEYGAFRLWTNRETAQVLRPIMRDLGLNADQPVVEGACMELARYYGSLAHLDVFQPVEFKAELFRALLQRYEDAKGAAEAWDFDDLVLRALGLLEDPAVSRRVRSRWRFILVDEFQDTNRAQFEFLKAIVDQSALSIQVVGDSDQAIYSWRGGDPGLFLDFTETFPGCSTVVLATNFRSTEAIVGPAARLISHNQQRHPKDFRAVRKGGEPPVLLRPESTLGEDVA